MRPLDVLAVAPYVPYRGVPHAGGVYLLRHLEALADRHRVTLLVPGSDEAESQAARAPEWLDLVLCPLELDERTQRRRVQDAIYRRAMGAPPGPTAESLRAVRRAGLVARARHADVVELHWPEYARFASELRKAGVRTPISVVEHDVDIEANARRLREYATGYRRVLGLCTAPLASAREKAGLRDADVVLVFKQEDEALLRRLGVRTRVRTIDPWLEMPDPTSSDDRIPMSALFAGAMWRRENSDGAVWFLEQVWPHVRREVTDASLILAGAGPGEDLLAAASAAEGVEVTGEVPELLPYFQRASVFVAPMFIGGGLKFKVAQAMLCGLPVVATRNAAQGIVQQAPEDVLWGVTDDPAEMAGRVTAAFTDPAAAGETGARAAAWAAERWSFQRSLEGVLADYESLARAAGADVSGPPAG